ncbi:MAG: hypothetical protein PVF54_05010 [Anaerolineae bacterium]
MSQWLTSMPADTMEWEIDEEAGIYGHEITLLDFDKAPLDRYRRIADIVRQPDGPQVETAVSLAGSAAQGMIRRCPGDCDYFERVNIRAETREEASQILADLMREKATDTMAGPHYDLVEVRFGTWKTDVTKEGDHLPAGSPISWSAEEVKEGKIRVRRAWGEPWEVDWKSVCLDPGWCKMEWVIAEPEQGRVVNASNMLDVTWETPDGDIVPLDGLLDPYLQEVNLDAESVPLFTKLARHVSPRALDKYVQQITREANKYTRDPANYGKAAKRLYNIFRLTGQHEAAALIRELFDEPAALLYQVWALLDTVDEASRPDSTLDRRIVVRQTDRLIRDVVECCEGPMESEIVMALLRLRDDITGWMALGQDRGLLITDSRAKVESLVNAYFKDKLLRIPEAVEFIQNPANRR